MLKYKYYIETDTETRQVYPLGGNEWSLNYELEENQIFKRAKLNGKVIFVNDRKNFRNDFEFLNDLRLVNPCQKVYFSIELEVAGVYTVIYYSYFSLCSGEWDESRCVYGVEVNTADKYTDYIDNQDVKYNLTKVSKETLSLIWYRFIEWEIIYAITGSNLNDSVLINQASRGYNEEDNLAYCGYSPAGQTPFWTDWVSAFGRYTIYVDISIVKIFTNIGWIEDNRNNGIAKLYKQITGLSILETYNVGSSIGETLMDNERIFHVCWGFPHDMTYFGTAIGIESNIKDLLPIQLSTIINCPDNSQILAYLTLYTFLYKIIQNIGGTDYTRNLYKGYLPDGFTLNEYSMRDAMRMDIILKYFKKQIAGDEDLISEFFTNATNPVTGIASKTKNLYLIQKSDWKRWGSSNRAIKADTSFREFMDDIRNLFNVYWDIDSNGNLVVEHLSHFEGIEGLDFSASSQINGNAKYKYDESKFYSSETWGLNDTYEDEFLGRSIIYTGDCTKKDNTLNHEVRLISTDVIGICKNSDQVSDVGFVMVTVDVDKKVVDGNSVLKNTTFANADLAMTNLHANYWKHGRVLATGTMNDTATTFTSVSKKRKQEITVKLCDIINFNPAAMIKTQLGWGNVESVSIKLNSGEAKISLLHE